MVLVVSCHGVEDGEELSGAGGDDDFERFAGGLEASAEGFDGGIMAAGDEACEIEEIGRAHV